jgi:hypothetical protein
MKYYLDDKLIKKKDIPFNAIEITTYGDFFKKKRRYITGIRD